MSTYYLLLVEKGDFKDDFNLSKNEIRLQNVVIVYRVIMTCRQIKAFQNGYLKLTRLSIANWNTEQKIWFYFQKTPNLLNIYSVSDSQNWKIPVQAANLINIWKQNQGLDLKNVSFIFSVQAEIITASPVFLFLFIYLWFEVCKQSLLSYFLIFCVAYLQIEAPKHI